MTYEESIDYLYNSRPPFHVVGAKAYKPGLENVQTLMAHFGEPHQSFRCVHVAGTNGKGSTSHLIAAALQAAGLKVGLYTSPHLVDFRERIRINGKMIEKDEVSNFVEKEKAYLDAVQPSFFETITALAFQYFAKEKVDIAVVETGLGGRLDATNIVAPLVSVITNIGLDHTEFLGSTLSAIAAEKAGIMKPGVPCVIGETQAETEQVFLNKAADCGLLQSHGKAAECGLQQTDGQPNSKAPGLMGELGLIWFADQCSYLRSVRRKNVPQCELSGAYQEKNMQTAYVALRVLRSVFPTLTEKAIAEGFAHVCTLTGLRGRWEVLSQTPLTICDTGHNSHGIRTYVEQLKELSKGDRHLRIVFGMVSDKDVDTVMELLPRSAYYYWCEAQTKRAIPADEMCRKGLTHGLIGMAYGPVEVAVHAAQKDAGPEDVLFIGGSNYVVGEAIKESFANHPLITR